jgi:FKBP-type peptidyl-prolyl cis-trans isomerase
MKTRLLPLLLFVTAVLRGAEPAAPSPPTAGFPREVYLSLGSNFAQQARLAQLGWSPGQFEAFLEGLRATFQGHPYATSDAARQLQLAVNQRVQELAKGDMRAYFADPKRLEEYMKTRARELKLQRSDTGLAFGLMAARGPFKPGPEDTVVVSYQAVAADGQTELPALTVDHKRVRVDQLMPGLAEGIQMLTAGGSGLFIVPPDLVPLDGRWPDGLEPGTPVIITLMLHEVVPAP